VNKLDQLTAAKRAEIAQPIYSDAAAFVTELQEESKMLHLELMRLKWQKHETETQVREASAQLEDVCQRCSPAALAKQQKAMRELEKEIAEQRVRNQVAEEKVAQTRTEQDGVGQEEEKRRARIEELRAMIRAEQNEMAALDQQMAQMKEAHAAEMQRLQSQV
jgi:uncharacterized coiled-coil DUF342 family protein